MKRLIRVRDGRRLARIVWCEVATLAVVLTGDIPWWLSLLVLSLVPLFGLADGTRRWQRHARSLSSMLAVGYLLFFPLDWFYFSGRLIFATVHLMFYLKLHTLLHLETERDENRLNLICVFELVAAASMTVNATFLVPMLLFVVGGIVVFVLDRTRPRKLDREVWRPVLRTSAILAAMILVLAGGIFVSIPRSTFAGFRLGGVTGITRTGFSEQVQLGDFEEIQRSQDVVMRIVSRDVSWSAPRWRGPAYDRYRDGGWFQSLSGVSSLPRAEPGTFLLDRPSELQGNATQSEVFLEPLDTDVLFLPPASSTITSTERYVFVDPYLTLRTGRSARAGRRYAVTWRPEESSSSSPVGGVEHMGRSRRRLYTQVPELSSRFHELAEEVTVAGADNPLDAARAVERYLESNYGYTLVQPERHHQDPLEDFLFEAKAGHCEYFATAMALMLRSRDVPTRLVTGFVRGEMNALGEYEVVRKSNAHAWVEVFDSQAGWVSFDPTPPAPGAEVAEAPDLIAQGIDSLRMLWDMYVVAYDAERQRGVFRGASALGDTIARAALQVFQWGRKRAVIAVVVIGFAVGVFFARRLAGTRWGLGLRLRWPLWLRWPGWKRRRPGRPETSVAFYEDFLTRLERLGFRKLPADTPAEYARSMESRLPGISELTEIYYRVRFGGVALETAAETYAERLARAVCLAAVSDVDIVAVKTARSRRQA